MLQSRHLNPLLLPYRTSSYFTVYSTRRHIGSSSTAESLRNPLEIDSALQTQLHDADFTLKTHRPRTSHSKIVKELNIIPPQTSDSAYSEAELNENEVNSNDSVSPHQRKSLAAQFGSQRIGSVTIPTELRDSIQRLISDTDNRKLRFDAKRLFYNEDELHQKTSWKTSYDVEYKTRKQAAAHADGDGMAFASVALSAHYSAICAVMTNVKWRLGTTWNVDRVIDFGSGAGTGLWASMHSFQRVEEDAAEPTFSQSTIMSYLGFDKREGLALLAKKLLKGMERGDRRFEWREDFSHASSLSEDHGTLAMSAFYLSTLNGSGGRRQLLKQMWNTGADTIMLIDHDSHSGFQCIAEARDYLLRLGKREANEDLKCHVVAPCPHDGPCPLYHPDLKRLKCTFSQRLQRPSFVRRTKHVHAGHEDVGYSYVVIRRQMRPKSQSGTDSEAWLESDAPAQPVPEDEYNDVTESESKSFEEDLRVDAYQWPRIVYPPMKKSGHVVLDSCTSEGKIMRLTIPRSQGKQAYYDARKSSWGDIFPHSPKNPPQIRYQPKKSTTVENQQLQTPTQATLNPELNS